MALDPGCWHWRDPPTWLNVGDPVASVSFEAHPRWTFLTSLRCSSAPSPAGFPSSASSVAGGLSHPNIVAIHLVEERDDLVYFVMAFVDGESLGDRVRRAGPLQPSDVARLVQEVAWALAYAHGRGVVHRDIKPDNILIDGASGRAMVTDFGIARVATSHGLSEEGEVVGTLQYMSPEQAGADPAIDGRADLYSLGVTAFFALAGRVPFEAPNSLALLAMHATVPAPPVLSARTGIPARLAEAVDRCLAKDPAARFANGEALADAIAEAQLTQRDIAPSVREFLSAAKNGAAQIAGLWFIWSAAAWAAERIATTGPGVVGGALDPLLIVLFVMTPIVTIRPLLAARGVVRAGLDEGDVAEAAAATARSRDANVEYQLARAKQLGDRLSTIWGRAAFLAVSAFPLAGPVFQTLLAKLQHAGMTPLGVSVLFQLVVAGGAEAFALGMAISPKRIIAALTHGTSPNTDLHRKLWSGSVGRAWLRIAGIGLARSKPRPIPDMAPTEVLIGRAAGALFAQLSGSDRARLGDVLAVIGRLERTGAALRVRRDDLAKFIAEAGGPGGSAKRVALLASLQSALVAVEARLGTTVTALENLRLDLLQLRSGVGPADDLTATIAQARAIGETVDAELAARHDVESFLESHSGLSANSDKRRRR